MQQLLEKRKNKVFKSGLRCSFNEYRPLETKRADVLKLNYTDLMQSLPCLVLSRRGLGCLEQVTVNWNSKVQNIKSKEWDNAVNS